MAWLPKMLLGVALFTSCVYGARLAKQTTTEPDFSKSKAFLSFHEPSPEPLSKASDDPIVESNGNTNMNDQNKYNLSDLMNYCPFADICFRKGRAIPHKSVTSCCSSCSCNPSCKLRNNCCYSNLNMENAPPCYKPQTGKEAVTNEGIQYILVDKCLNSSFGTDCKSVSTEPWGSLYPVYDDVSDTFFYNQNCAECNGAEDYTHWDVTVQCRHDGSFLANDAIIGALLGKKCAVGFMPPSVQELDKHICNTDIIKQCNETGLWQNYDADLELACSRWYSPYLDEKTKELFSNIFCFFCNGFEHTNQVVAVCSEKEPTRLPSFYPTLTTIIDYEKISHVIKKPKEAVSQLWDGNCRRHMVKHPLKDECRIVSCPDSYFRIDEICTPISSAKTRLSYSIQLKMTPATDDKLPMSYLYELVTNKNDYYHPEVWFNSRGVPLDYFTLYAEPVNDTNTSFVRTLIVSVGKDNHPVKVDKVIKLIEKAIGQLWEITLHRKVYSFSVKIDKFVHFVHDGSLTKHDTVEAMENQNYIYETPTKSIYHRIIHQFPRPPKTPRLILKKTNFCERVHLIRSEWIGLFQEIRLNLTVSGNETVLGDSEFNIYLDDHGQAAVDICVEDFNPLYYSVTTDVNGATSRFVVDQNCVFLLSMFLSVFLGLTVLSEN